MNKLIEQLIDRFETECHLSFDCIEREKFAQAIQTACKAQRNACARDFRYNRRNTGLSVAEKSIKNAEIRKEDYE